MAVFKSPKPLKKGSRRTRDEQKAETRQNLIDAAVAIIHEGGYSQLTINTVAQRAGLTSGAMQHHFPARGDLVVAVMNSVFPILNIPIDDLELDGMPPRERMDVFIDVLWGVYRRPEYVAIWEVILGTRTDKQLRKLVRAYRAEATARIHNYFKRAFPNVSLTAEQIGHVATLISSTLRGLALLSLFDSDTSRELELRLLKKAAFSLISED